MCAHLHTKQAREQNFCASAKHFPDLLQALITARCSNPTRPTARKRGAARLGRWRLFGYVGRLLVTRCVGHLRALLSHRSAGLSRVRRLRKVGAEVRSHALWSCGGRMEDREWMRQGSVGWLRRSGWNGLFVYSQLSLAS